MTLSEHWEAALQSIVKTERSEILKPCYKPNCRQPGAATGVLVWGPFELEVFSVTGVWNKTFLQWRWRMCKLPPFLQNNKSSLFYLRGQLLSQWTWGGRVFATCKQTNKRQHKLGKLKHNKQMSFVLPYLQSIIEQESDRREKNQSKVKLSHS